MIYFLLDFNAAKFFSTSTTEDTVLLGTKGYAAPEQYGFGASTPKTDIYAVGILLNELTSSLTNIPYDLTKIIDSNNITTFDFSINVPKGYKLYAILLLEVENVTKPAMSEVREVIVIN